jgi:hypothetical protein
MRPEFRPGSVKSAATLADTASVMKPQSDHPQEVRHVVLPSGKAIEVVYFQALPEGPVERDERLGVCPDCRGEHVQPVDWEEHDASRWKIDLRCPNCYWTGSGIWNEEVVEAFDEVLDRGTQTLLRDLRGLARANMEDEIERFSSALDSGNILPEDF